MAQSEQLAKMRASNALTNVTASEEEQIMHIGTYSTSWAGSSITATLGELFTAHHDLSDGERIEQFFDADTGALVIIPESSTDRVPSMEAGDD